MPNIFNDSPFLVAYRPDGEGGAHYVNAIVVNGSAVTVGHMTGRFYTVLDPVSGFKVFRVEYGEIDSWMDAGILDLICGGEGYSMGVPVIGEDVKITWFNLDPEGPPKYNSTSGRIIGTYDLNGHKRYDINIPPEKKKISCGAAVTRIDSGILLGIVNAGEFAGIGPNTTIKRCLMTSAADIQKQFNI